MDISKVIKACNAASPETKLPRELRQPLPKRGKEDTTLSTPAAFALMTSIRRGGTFDDAA